ncbi:NIPSNAP protein [Marinoscillum furvescens DSM 4134]|uniref:NIPSNAP protein n=2 Tax=Marinoscillum furvescens TaxID=1026 RepID=A0A3D9KXC8_MARFU|nr:NIPSNAP protein [Marinoscillum furvescens DSM 4134]
MARCTPTTAPASETHIADRAYHQLKIYHLDSEEQEMALDSYLRKAYLPALKRHGFQGAGVFKLRPEQDTLRKTYVLQSFSALEDIVKLDEVLLADETYLKAGSAYLHAAHDNPPYNRISTVLMRAFADFPSLVPTPLTGFRADRIYELRSYESATEFDFKNKVDMFNAGGEVKLFDKLGFNAVFYGEVLAGASMPNLMYMTTFADQKSRDDHWKAFVDSPEWNDLKVLPEYQNNVSHIDITFLYPTAYSGY